MIKQHYNPAESLIEKYFRYELTILSLFFGFIMIYLDHSPIIIIPLSFMSYILLGVFFPYLLRYIKTFELMRNVMAWLHLIIFFGFMFLLSSINLRGWEFYLSLSLTILIFIGGTFIWFFVKEKE